MKLISDNSLIVAILSILLGVWLMIAIIRTWVWTYRIALLLGWEKYKEERDNDSYATDESPKICRKNSSPNDPRR